MITIKKLLFLISVLALLTACTTPQANTQQELVQDEPAEDTIKTITLGGILPFTGESSASGEGLKSVQMKAIDDINERWASQDKNMKLEIVYEDGACNGEDGSAAAQTLIEKGITIILGGFCSGETLAAAPHAEENKVILFSPGSTNPSITQAGDYIFRNVVSDAFQSIVVLEEMQKREIKTLSIISENTPYATGISNILIEKGAEYGIEIVKTQIVEQEQQDISAEMQTIEDNAAEAIFLSAQTSVMAARFTSAIGDTQAALFGNDVFSEEVTIARATIPQGFITFRQVFDKENPKFVSLLEETNCQKGYYCASAYDGVKLISEIISQCGDDQNTDCIRDGLYATKNWEGDYQGTISFDENGDISGVFQALVYDGQKYVALSDEQKTMQRSQTAVKMIEYQGEDAFDFIRNDIDGEEYVFIWSMEAIRLVFPPDPSKEGDYTSDLKDANGKPIGEIFVQTAKEGGGWVEYVYPKPGETEPSPKKTYIAPAVYGDKTYIVGSGYYLS